MKTLTWKEFKEAVEAAGITDDMPIFYIDTGNYPTGLHVVNLEKDGVKITDA